MIAPMVDRSGAIPFALFRTSDGRTVAMSEPDYRLAEATARLCQCHACDCCRAVEYVATQRTGGAP